MTGMHGINNIRVGIDVGGTFTHAVAINSSTMKLVGQIKVPTSHRSDKGVAEGIIQALNRLLSESDIDPKRVGFIAHSTTQATNALLEGDVAPVGIIAMGSGPDAWLAKRVSHLGKIELAPDKYLSTYHDFLSTNTTPTRDDVQRSVEKLVKQGAVCIAVSESFSVDNPENEEFVAEIVRELGFPATAGCEVSQLYGYKVRTRTAVINASMLPKMIESADMTEKSVREAGITAPVMIMRSDGGVMDIDSMRKRPILTMLSGPAAGVAAAMMFLQISDGIFLEVGGTSTDISAISDGRARVKSAEIGGHRVYMKTLDVRTVGVAGGSLPRAKKGKLHDVGPRSAHIAGLAYTSFANELEDVDLASFKFESIKPMADDPDDYIALKAGQQEKASYCITPTCAANLLGLVPEENCAKGSPQSIEKAFAALSAHLSRDPKELAGDIQTLASQKCMPIVDALIKEYKLDRELVYLIGGGGGAAAIVPFLAEKMNLRFRIAEHADVISAIGVALALIRETIERQIVNPTDDDVLRLRHEAHAAVESMGADPGTIEVHIEVDSRTNILRATAYGASSMNAETSGVQPATSETERKKLVADSMRVAPELVSLRFDGKYFKIYTAAKSEKQLMGLWRKGINSARVVDQAGGIRLQFRNAVIENASTAQAEKVISTILEEHAEWGDAGKVIPGMVLLVGPKIVDLSGLLDAQQVLTLARAELQEAARDSDVVAIAKLD